MRSAFDRALVARLGTSVFAVALALPTTLPGTSAHLVGTTSARTSDVLAVEVEAMPSSAEAVGPLELPESRTPPRPPSRALAAEAPILDGVVLASWYGPGFYGRRTACGMTYTAEIVGVAHRTLPCGTRVRITSPAGVTVVVSVIDRGPYVVGRTLDLSAATKDELLCSDLCRVRMTVLQ